MNDVASRSALRLPSKETKVRIATGGLGGIVLLCLIVYGEYLGVCFVAAILAGAMCWECSNVFYSRFDRKEKTYALLGSAWLAIFVNMLFPKSMLECLVVSFIGLFIYYLATAERHFEDLKKHFDEFVLTVFTLVYVVTFVAFLPLIRQGPNGAHWTILFLLIVWMGDTGAYFIGRQYGRRRLYPLISPKKSVEGAIGGLSASIVAALVYKGLALKGVGWGSVFLTAVAIGVLSQAGDLCESFFKRAYKIKDSGTILPGHGGVLDRFDGVLFSLPVMYFCIKAFNA